MQINLATEQGFRDLCILSSLLVPCALCLVALCLCLPIILHEYINRFLSLTHVFHHLLSSFFFFFSLFLKEKEYPNIFFIFSQFEI